MKGTIEYQNIRGNRKHKDSLFRKVFRKKKDLLELYNAINGTDYKNEDVWNVRQLCLILIMGIIVC